MNSVFANAGNLPQENSRNKNMGQLKKNRMPFRAQNTSQMYNFSTGMWNLKYFYYAPCK